MNKGELSIFSISFINTWWFSVYTSFNSLVKFLPNYFTDFNPIVNGIIFLLSFSNSSLLMHNNITNFAMLILYPLTLMKFFISPNSFWWSLPCFLYIVSGICKKKKFYFFISDLGLSWVSFSCLFVLSKTSSTVLSRNDESRHLFVSDLRGEVLSFSPLIMILVVGLSYDFY